MGLRLRAFDEVMSGFVGAMHEARRSVESLMREGIGGVRRLPGNAPGNGLMPKSCQAERASKCGVRAASLIPRTHDRLASGETAGLARGRVLHVP